METTTFCSDATESAPVLAIALSSVFSFFTLITIVLAASQVYVQSNKPHGHGAMQSDKPLVTAR